MLIDIVPISNLVNLPSLEFWPSWPLRCLACRRFFSILQVVEGAEKGEAVNQASIFNRTLLALGRLGVTRPKLDLSLFVAVALVVGVGTLGLHFSHNQLHYFPEDSDFLRHVRIIEAQA